MGIGSNFAIDQAELDYFIEGVTTGHNDPCYTAPTGYQALISVYKTPNNKAFDVEGIMYDYPNSTNTKKRIFVPDANPHKYLVVPANDIEDEHVGYHNLKASDL